METLRPGTRLGPYEIVAPLGAGGMGEVWRARDTRLDRSVAIKVLPAEFAENPQLKVRFEREAKAISQLNHPHVCTLYDVGDSYLVMELLEGESLADRIARGPLPMPDVLKYGMQIADALDKAHRAGIVHRDLKPGNIMITKSGAKLLDFGLAKTAVVPGIDDLTAHKPLTAEGTILGTFQYMAPEQLEGDEADARTDIFALGAVLYEMATGRRAFSGKTKTSLIAAIVQSEPAPISAIQPMTPPSFEHVVTTCLAKERDDRWQSARDVAAELRWIAQDGGVASAPRPRKRSMERIAWALAVVAALLGGWFAARRMTPRRVEPPIRFDVALPEHTGVQNAAVAPDGRSFAYVGVDREHGSRSLYVYSLDTGQTRTIMVFTTIPPFIFWSPDNKKIAFVTGEQLRVVTVENGLQETICDTKALRGSWGRMGEIVFDVDGATYRVSDRGGQPVLILPRSPENSGQHSLCFLPDGGHFLFVRTDALGDPAAVYCSSLDGKDVRRLFAVDRYTFAAYAAPGTIIYNIGSKLFARAFDARTLSITGEPMVLLDAVVTNGAPQRAWIGESGAVMYRVAGDPGMRQVVVVDRNGRQVKAIGRPAPIWHIAPSHDQQTLALEILDPKEATTDTWSCNVETGVTSRLTTSSKYEWQMTWMNDDSRIIFASNERDNSDIFSIAATGGQPSLVYTNKSLQAPLDVSMDGKYLLYMDNSAGRKYDILAFPLAGGSPIAVAATPFDEMTGRFSPDAKWVAYSSDDSGRDEVYVQEFPVPRHKIQVSLDGGATPSWRGDGRELYYLAPSGDIMSVSVDASVPRFGKPVLLLHGAADHLQATFGRYLYAPFPDGQQFYVATQVSPPGERPFKVILNATSALAGN